MSTCRSSEKQDTQCKKQKLPLLLTVYEPGELCRLGAWRVRCVGCHVPDLCLFLCCAALCAVCDDDVLMAGSTVRYVASVGEDYSEYYLCVPFGLYNIQIQI